MKIELRNVLMPLFVLPREMIRLCESEIVRVELERERESRREGMGKVMILKTTTKQPTSQAANHTTIANTFATTNGDDYCDAQLASLVGGWCLVDGGELGGDIDGLEVGEEESEAGSKISHLST